MAGHGQLSPGDPDRPPDLALQDAVDRYFMRFDHSAFPVDERGQTISLLTLRKVRRVPSDQWPTSRVRDHMVPLSDQNSGAPGCPMDQVMAKLEDGEAGRVLAAEGGEVVGIWLVGQSVFLQSHH